MNACTRGPHWSRAPGEISNVDTNTAKTISGEVTQKILGLIEMHVEMMHGKVPIAYTLHFNAFIQIRSTFA